LANVYFCKGDYDHAQSAFERYHDVCTDIGYKIGIGVALNSLACIHAVRERYDEAIRMFERALKLCEELRSYEGIGVACGNLSSVCTATGDFEHAVAMGERDLAVSTSIGNQRGVIRAHSFLCEAYLEAGEYQRARREAEVAVELLTGLGDDWKLATNWIYLAEIERLEQGDLDKASVLCERASNLAERTDTMGRMGLFHFVAGKVAAQRGDAIQAEQLLTRAMSSAEASGQRRLTASILRFRAGMARESGDEAGARRLLKSARTIYLELGLEHWVKECDLLSSEM
jgi:tetratricopeptide (TPR) repeat protein